MVCGSGVGFGGSVRGPRGESNVGFGFRVSGFPGFPGFPGCRFDCRGPGVKTCGRASAPSGRLKAFDGVPGAGRADKHTEEKTKATVGPRRVPWHFAPDFTREKRNSPGPCPLSRRLTSISRPVDGAFTRGGKTSARAEGASVPPSPGFSGGRAFPGCLTRFDF